MRFTNRHITMLIAAAIPIVLSREMGKNMRHAQQRASVRPLTSTVWPADASISSTAGRTTAMGRRWGAT